jgi:hypothetical protein
VKTKKAKALLVAPNISAVEGEGEEGAEYPVAPLLQVCKRSLCICTARRDGSFSRAQPPKLQPPGYTDMFSLC